MAFSKAFPIYEKPLIKVLSFYLYTAKNLRTDKKKNYMEGKFKIQTLCLFFFFKLILIIILFSSTFATKFENRRKELGRAFNNWNFFWTSGKKDEKLK